MNKTSHQRVAQPFQSPLAEGGCKDTQCTVETDRYLENALYF